jgi:hypothetical protein
LILFLAAVVSATAVDAERAFSRAAQRNGQWTAFRTYADPDAVIFTPEATWAREFLQGKKEQTAAIHWWPSASYVSCDGRMAVNTGAWRDDNGGQSGLFTTVWEQEDGHWRWISHGRHTLERTVAPRAAPVVRHGSCHGRAPGPPLMATPSAAKGPGGLKPEDFGRGYSSDRTLGWDWKVGAKGVRHFRAFLWTGHRYTLAFQQTIGGKWGQ